MNPSRIVSLCRVTQVWGNLLGVGLMLCVVNLARAAAFVPQSGEEVLERLRPTAFDAAAHEIHQLRARLAADATNVPLACQLARRCIERGRTDADPRFLGRAQSALAPWWEAATPPVDVLILRATIKQSQHDFANALADLDAAAHLAPATPQVWLTRATILTVLGEYAKARQACVRLVEVAPGIVALTALANVSSLSGGAESACGLLRNSLSARNSASVAERRWALTVLAEAEARIGRVAAAEADFKDALALGPPDPYLLGAYADVLLAQRRAGEVVELLGSQPRADALLLRLARAESALTPVPATLAGHVASLRARFEAGHLRGDFVHQREEAQFTLHLLHQPQAALQLAQINWQVQREPADALIFLESAVAAGAAGDARPALDFIRSNRLEDVQLNRLAQQLDPK